MISLIVMRTISNKNKFKFHQPLNKGFIKLIQSCEFMSLFNDSSKELSHKSHFSHESDYTARAVGLYLCAACEVSSILRLFFLPLFCNTLPFYLTTFNSDSHSQLG